MVPWDDIWARAKERQAIINAADKAGEPYDEQTARESVVGGYQACLHRSRDWLYDAEIWERGESKGKTESHETCWSAFRLRVPKSDHRHNRVADASGRAKDSRNTASYDTHRDFTKKEFDLGWMYVDDLFNTLCALPSPEVVKEKPVKPSRVRF